MAKYGYVRVSTKEQCEDRQMIAMEAAAKARGVRFGREEKAVPDDFESIVRRWEEKQITIEDALRLCGVSESTFFRRLRKRRQVEDKIG